MNEKNILGLDLGVTSVGFAHVVEGEVPDQSSIKKIGVRIIQFDNFSKIDKSGKVSESKNPEQDFTAGRGLSPNADRTLKRSMRKNLNRYQDRRNNLIDILQQAKLITKDSILAEDGKKTTHETLRLRAKAVTERIEKEQLARVLLAINKKRGYKSSRKTKSEGDGQAIDGMAIAKRLYEEKLTPGQLVHQLLKEGKKYIPEFYRSDLQVEFDNVWRCQQKFYPDIFTNEFYKELQGKGQKSTAASFWGKYKFNTAENKGAGEEKRLQSYEWRSKAVSERLRKEEAAYVITEINNNLHNSSGYLGAISDRSKELYFNKETVGQYLYKQIHANPHTRLKNQVFYRQDYLDEFEAIWKEQSKHHTELTDNLKSEIRDITIFYQRKLKSQKNLISICEFENREIEVGNNRVKKVAGLKVAPKSSPLFQEFKIWQNLNNLKARKKGSRKRTASVTASENSNEVFIFDLQAKLQLFEELNIKGNLKAEKALEQIGYKHAEWELNYIELEGNRTNKALYEAYLRILEMEGYDVKELLKVKLNKDEVMLSDLNVPASEIKDLVKRVFDTLKIDTAILEFNPELDGRAFEQQHQYRLWHLLHSAEDDIKKYTDNEVFTYGTNSIGLKKQLCEKFGFKPEHAKILTNIRLSDDYGSLSTKAMRKIYPYIKEHKYSEACAQAGYKHSAASLTKDEIANRPLKNKLELLKKNSLRNPVVEKILNQMVNVINTLIDTNSKRDAAGNITEYFRFDEIRIELARELKKNAAERAEMTSNIGAAKLLHDRIVKILQTEFGIKTPSRNDVIRYKLYEELKNNGYKDLYTDEYIPREILFSKQIDIDHIIAQSRVFDDSFSNKTVIYRKDNLRKGNRTAFDYIESEYGQDKLEEYLKRIQNLFELNKKSKEEGISKAKFQKLQKRESEIGDGFIERELRDSQYIAKKAKNMLYDITRSVVSTSGSITDRLREDWDLVNLMQEINFDKFKKLGLTEKVEKKDGTFKERIVDWSKRNDHRHHAMDALTVAFTKHNHIQYLNYLNARYNEAHKEHLNIKGIEDKETHVEKDDAGNNKRVFNLPIANFRALAKEHLESVLVSHKSKNKVVTKNKNKIKTGSGEKVNTELTPRGQLHKETVYGKYQYPVFKEEKAGTKLDLETLNKVGDPVHKKLLLERLAANGNDPKKAFTGKNALSKNPIYLNDEKTEVLPETVKLTWLEAGYSIRKDVTPENFKDEKTIDKVLDQGVKRIMLSRLNEYGNDPKKAFSDLEKNPIWLNREKGIAIKRVTITGVSNAEALHFKKDHRGNPILDNSGKSIPVDFVSTGNNHHVAIYRDSEGKLQDKVISFFEVVERVNQQLPVIDKDFNHGAGWQFLFTMKQNEYFVFPNEQLEFNPKEIDLSNPNNNKIISPNLFRVQKISKVSYGNSSVREYVFRHHLETSVDDKKELKEIAFKNIKSLGYFESIVKVQINHIGQIVKVGQF